MQELADVAELRAVLRNERCAGRSVGFVPTMGFLHAGHARLMDVARHENDLLILSIFVNPMQFGPNEDYDRYPRDPEHDRAMALEHGVDVVFSPDLDVMYPGGVGAQRVTVDPGPMADYLEGAARPGHFRGVTTVVTKLFHMVDSDRAYFGQKDAQQVLIVKRMVRDLAFGVEIRVVPTVREPDGLALSSRNLYLTPEERRQAVCLFAALQRAETLIRGGERDSVRIVDGMSEVIHRIAPSARIDAIAVTDLDTLRPVTGPIDTDVLIPLAVYIGSTRLIDNVIARVNGAQVSFS